MLRPRIGQRRTLGALSLLGSFLLVACAAAPPLPRVPSPLPQLGPLSAAERAQILRDRTTGVQTLSAVLAVSFSVGTQHGTMDMVVNYAAPDAMRFTALKETLLHTQTPFDVLLRGDTYRVMTQDAAGEQVHQGTRQSFAKTHPTFRTFFIVAEAFFVPGVDAQARAPRFNTTGTRFATGLRSGVQARWQARAETLEILQACLTWQTEAESVSVRVQYQDYRQVGAVYLPYRVTITDPRLGFTAQSVVKQVELNVPLASGVFDLTP